MGDPFGIGFVEAIMPEGSTQRTACRHQVLKITVCTSFYFLLDKREADTVSNVRIEWYRYHHGCQDSN